MGVVGSRVLLHLAAQAVQAAVGCGVAVREALLELLLPLQLCVHVLHGDAELRQARGTPHEAKQQCTCSGRKQIESWQPEQTLNSQVAWT